MCFSLLAVRHHWRPSLSRVLSPLCSLGALLGQDLSEVPASMGESGPKFQLTFWVGTVADSFLGSEVVSLEVLSLVRESM
jgi:hypothetical protein